VADEEKEKAELEGDEKSEKIGDRFLNQEIPPANFFSLVTTFQIPAMQFLGELADPSTEKVEVHPSLAKYYIDCLSVLDEKTKGNLSPDEKKVIDTVLAQLTLLYVKNSPGSGIEGE
jgi:hypothetical protein